MHSTEFDSRESWLEISLEPITLEPSTMEQISGMATGVLLRAVCFPASEEVRGGDGREEMVCDVVHASSDGSGNSSEDRGRKHRSDIFSDSGTERWVGPSFQGLRIQRWNHSGSPQQDCAFRKCLTGMIRVPCRH